MTTATETALDAFVAAHETYHAAAAKQRGRWYDADARARCHLALSALQRAEAALIEARKAERP